MGPFRALLFLAGLLGLEFGDVLLRVLLEGVSAAGAAYVIGLALVADWHGAEAARDDTFVFLFHLAQADAFPRAADQVIFLPDSRSFVLVGDAIDEAIALRGRVHLDLLRCLGVWINAFERQDFT